MYGVCWRRRRTGDAVLRGPVFVRKATCCMTASGLIEAEMEMVAGGVFIWSYV